MGTGDYIVLGLFVTLILPSIYFIYDADVNTHWVCHNEAVVLDILSVNYRHATFLTDKGEVTLSQSRIKDGDTICLRGSHVRNE